MNSPHFFLSCTEFKFRFVKSREYSMFAIVVVPKPSSPAIFGAIRCMHGDHEFTALSFVCIFMCTCRTSQFADGSEKYTKTATCWWKAR